jgi:hypothetical protein
MECVFEKFMDGMVAGCRIAVNSFMPTLPDIMDWRASHGFVVVIKLINW